MSLIDWDSLELENVLAFFCILVTGIIVLWVIGWGFNLPDYSYHLHEIWAVSEGNFFFSPYLGGGEHQIFRYGLPIDLLGGLIYPVFGKYTVSVLLAFSFPFLFAGANKVFKHLVSERLARIGALLAVMNPFTYGYFVAGALPFIWGTVIGLFSLHFFMKEDYLVSIAVGILAVLTHPVSGLLFLSLFLVKDLRTKFYEWIETYSLPIVVFVIILGSFYGLFSGLYSAGSVGFNVHFLYRLPLLLGAFALCYSMREETRFWSGLGFIVTGIWALVGLLGVWVPMGYFDRPAFFIILLLMPFLAEFWIEKLDGKDRFLVFPVLLVLIFGAVAGQVSFAPTHNGRPDNYYEGIDEIVEENELVYFGHRGMELHDLPRYENVKFSNSGMFPFGAPENEEALLKKVENQEASYILVYSNTYQNALVENIGFPKRFSHDIEVESDNYWLLENFLSIENEDILENINEVMGPSGENLRLNLYEVENLENIEQS